MRFQKIPVVYAVFAAVFYGMSVPAAKLLLAEIPPVFMAALLYIGAGVGMAAVNLFQKRQSREKEARVTKKEFPYVAAMVVLDIAAPILLMLGLSMTTPATVSLLGNFEIVATVTIALCVFKEAVGKRMWLAVALITLSSAILSVEDFGSLTFSLGALFVLLSCVSWGMENNCTRMLSLKNPTQIVIIKGIGSGCGSLWIAAFMGTVSADIPRVLGALLLGFFAYGMSVYFYIIAQRNLGAARTSAFYAFAPFIGAGLSFAIFREAPTLSFLIAFAVMTVGAYLAAFERHDHEHRHARMEHEHRHNHGDGHHGHAHSPPISEEHSHGHAHAPLSHSHKHAPDLHHTHTHSRADN